ncbi:type II secretion system F family protein [bacterium]|nr:type II secretion system F family protein [bacterium]MDB4731559.1 type II secretion system F family protein [bacterium]MDB4802749.1 type II secretion system F family protein [bacterium]
MGSPELTIVAFGSISMVATAVGLLLRDILFGGQNQTSKKSLRRTQTVYDRPVKSSLLGRIDQGFDRLIIESGIDISPVTGFLVLLASAMASGGAIMVYTNQLLYGIGGGILGLILPMFVFSIKRRARFRDIRQNLPTMIDILARATRTGQSIEQAIQLAAEESQGIIASELGKLNNSLNMGSSFDRAVKIFARRLPLVEIRILATTLMVQRQSGGHLSETLERMANVIRDRISIQNQIRATTGAGRLSTAVIAALAPAAFVVIMVVNPDHVEILMNDPTGRFLMVLGVVLEVLGLLWVLILMKNEN